MGKHTPGPWERFTLREVTAKDPDEEASNVLICTTYDSHQPEANARLISAAPDYAEVAPTAADILEQYAAFIRTQKSDDFELHPYLPLVEETAQSLRAAIAKAEGRS